MLNEPQQQELKRILDSDLFKAAMEEVLKKADWPIHEMLAPEQGMTLAVEKGVRKAFRILYQICEPHQSPATPSLRSSIKYTRTTDKP